MIYPSNKKNNNRYIPKHVNDVVTCNDKHNWKTGMRAELNALKKNNIWSFVDIPDGHNADGVLPLSVTRAAMRSVWWRRYVA